MNARSPLHMVPVMPREAFSRFSSAIIGLGTDSSMTSFFAGLQ